MTASNSDTELLTEHFGYPPVSLLDEIINSINFLAERALASVETGLLNAPPTQIGFGRPSPPSSSHANNANSKSKRKRKQHEPEPAEEDADLSPEATEAQARAEIAGGTHQLETLLCTSIDRNFDKFELYVMHNIMCVKPDDRDWIRLGHYEGLSFDNLPSSVLRPKPTKENVGGDEMNIDSEATSPEGDNPDIPTVDSVNGLRRRLQASQKLNTMLLAEQARNDALLGELRGIVGRVSRSSSKGALASSTTVKPDEDSAEKPPLAFLHDRGDLTQADAATPLATTTAFSLSQMQALRALSTSLSSILPDLRAATTAGDGHEQSSGGEGGAARKTWRKERVEYVEHAARKHLESVRGLELGRDGEVRDGEWQGEGRKYGSGEVGALESVVEVLEGEKGGENRDGEDDDDVDDEEMGDDGPK